MVFSRNDPKTIEAAKRGGNTGKKHLQRVSKEELKQLTTKGGKASGRVRRAKSKHIEVTDKSRASTVTVNNEDKVMHGYLET